MRGKPDLPRKPGENCGWQGNGYQKQRSKAHTIEMDSHQSKATTGLATREWRDVPIPIAESCWTDSREYRSLECDKGGAITIDCNTEVWSTRLRCGFGRLQTNSDKRCTAGAGDSLQCNL
jgi:hypothetical protein